MFWGKERDGQNAEKVRLDEVSLDHLPPNIEWVHAAP